MTSLHMDLHQQQQLQQHQHPQQQLSHPHPPIQQNQLQQQQQHQLIGHHQPQQIQPNSLSSSLGHAQQHHHLHHQPPPQQQQQQQQQIPTNQSPNQLMNTSTNSTITAPSKQFDEDERKRQRMEELRKHHDERTVRYNRTQPKINEQIHEDTIKILNSTQVNGSKAKSQKPRAPKKPRNANNNNIIMNNGSNVHNNIHQPPSQSIDGSTNGIPPQPPVQQELISSSQSLNHQGSMQQITLYPPSVQQPAMQHMQAHPHQMPPQPQQQHHQPQPQQQQPPQPQQQHYRYQTTNGIYQNQQQPPQPTMQNHHHYQQNQIYSHQQMQPSSHAHPQQIDQGHYVTQIQTNQQSHLNHNGRHHHQHPHTHQRPHQSHQSQHMNHHTQRHITMNPLPNDLDLTLQGGLECVDIESLINHEMSVEGQLDFKNDFLLQIDNNHYHMHHQ